MKKKSSEKAVVLLSGGMDSATCLALAVSEGYDCHALSFSYGQRHSVELDSAKKIAKSLSVAKHFILSFDLRKWGASALTSDKIKVPEKASKKIPVTYVPARNSIFLSFAAAWAETLGARDIFIGVNSLDYSGYPDCRPEFIKSFARAINLGTKAHDEGWKMRINAPLQKMSKAEIITMGLRLGLDFSLTWSCYNPVRKGLACGKCDSCRLRLKGFHEAGFVDPIEY